MSKITNDFLTRSSTGCFIAVPNPYGNSGRQRVNLYTLLGHANLWSKLLTISTTTTTTATTTTTTNALCIDKLRLIDYTISFLLHQFADIMLLVAKGGIEPSSRCNIAADAARLIMMDQLGSQAAVCTTVSQLSLKADRAQAHEALSSYYHITALFFVQSPVYQVFELSSLIVCEGNTDVMWYIL